MLKRNGSHYTPTLDKYEHHGGTQIIGAIDSIDLGEAKNNEWLTRFYKAVVITATFGKEEFKGFPPGVLDIMIDTVLFGFSSTDDEIFVATYNVDIALTELGIAGEDKADIAEKLISINSTTHQPDFIVSEIKNCSVELLSVFSKKVTPQGVIDM